MRTLALVLVLATWSRSGEPAPPSEASGSAAAAPSAACKAELASIQGYLRTLEHEAASVTMTSSTKLVSRPGLPAPPHVRSVELTRDKVLIGFSPMTYAELGARLGAERAMQDDPGFARSSPGYAGHPHELVFLIDETVRWGDVTHALDQAAIHGFDHVSLVFEGTTLPPPPHTAVDDTLAQARGQEVEALSKIAQGFVHQCPALIRAFMPGGGEDWYLKYFAPRIGEALAGCNCGISLPEFRSYLYHATVGIPKTGAVGVVLARTGTTIALPRAMAWRDAAAKITGGSIHPVAK